FVEGGAYCSVDVRAACARAHRVEGSVLELDHAAEHPFLLGCRLADEHRSLELGEISPDRRACPSDEHVARLEHEVSGQGVRNRRVASDLPAVARMRAVREEALRAVDLAYC